MRTASSLLDEYEASRVTAKIEPLYREFRAAARIDPRRYRGMGRSSMDPVPTSDLGELEELREVFDVRTDRAARLRLRELAGDDDPEDWDEKLVANFGEAEAVRRLADQPEDWELIFVSQSLEQTTLTIGFDVGWWGPEFYSLIADTFVVPTWHGPDEEAYPDLSEQAQLLNEWVLFDRLQDAHRFLTWYEGEDWSETDGFLIARIDAPR